MSKSSSNSKTGGISFLGLLAIVFITLKLMGYITWSWWWVTIPLWGGFALVVFVMVLVFIGALLVAALD